MTNPTETDPMPEAAPAEQTPKPPRRRFTPEERIANREKEIARIKEKQRERVCEMIDEAKEMLRDCALDATVAGMGPEAAQCDDALHALLGGVMIRAATATPKD